MPANTLTEKSSVVASLDADAYGTGTANGAAVAISNFRKTEVIVNYGTLGSTSTLVVKIQSSTDGTAFADLLGDDGVTVVAFPGVIPGTDDDTIIRGLIYNTELPLDTSHLRAVATVGVLGVDLSVLMRLGEPYDAPVVADAVAGNLGGNAFSAIHGVGAR